MTRVKILTKHRVVIVLVYKILLQFDGLKLKNDKIVGFATAHSRTDDYVTCLSYHTGLMSI